MNDNSQHWFAVFTNPKAEKKVAERLEEAGFEVYLPLMTTIRQWSDRKKKIKVPLINSYVFVRTTALKLKDTLKIPGVVTILKYLKSPAVIRDYEINNMRILLREEVGEAGFEKLSMRDIKKGEPVEILHGPFSGLQAEYIQHQGKYSVVVRTEALGSIIVVHVDSDHIKRITA
ncbi:MAG: UpxY family transcription antiterminator [Flavobacteriaceae bacterium]|nr:UpxY family transcription antiterminator [Flavobacteriaceae bacterium]